MAAQLGADKTPADTRRRTHRKTNRKTQIVAAAERLLRDKGLAGVTTRAIAEAVPCSEGAIYVHFQDRLELVLAVLQDALPDMLGPLHALEASVGKATPLKNLLAAANGLLRFQERVTPMLCALMMDQELLLRFRESLQREGKGPQRGIQTLARYIKQEQNLGRVDTRVDAHTAAAAIMAGCFFDIFTAQLFGSRRQLDVKGLVRMVLQVNMN